MLRVWAEARNGHGARAVLLLADSGAGRSRLVEELVARAELDGAGVALARAVPADRNHEDGALAALARSGLAQIPGVAAASPTAHAALSAQLPEWREWFPGAAPPEGGVPHAGALADAVTEIVRAASDDQAILVVLDDAHWMDERSLAAVVAMLRDLASQPLLVVVTAAVHASSPALDDLRARVGRDTPGVTLRLGPLDAAALRELAAAWLPHFGPAELDRVVRRVAADSGGVALLAAELFRAIAKGLELGDGGESGRWPAPDRTLDQTLPFPLPETLSAAIRVGSTRLAEASRRVLLAAAAGPERVTPAMLAAALGLSAQALAGTLDELEWEQWLVSDARGYTFRARVVRDVVARELMTPGQRRRMGEAMAGTGA
jgi:predicted ATPase